MAPDDKVQARKNVIAAPERHRLERPYRSVRINGLDTHFMYRDVVDHHRAGPRQGRPVHDPEGRTLPTSMRSNMLVTQCEWR